MRRRWWWLLLAVAAVPVVSFILGWLEDSFEEDARRVAESLPDWVRSA